MASDLAANVAWADALHESARLRVAGERVRAGVVAQPVVLADPHFAAGFLTGLLAKAVEAVATHHQVSPVEAFDLIFPGRVADG